MSELTLLQNDAYSLSSRAEIDMQISTAKAYPRSIKDFMNRAISAATFTPQIADSCSYALERGGKMIIGPSVRLAEIAYNSYGNCRAAARIVSTEGEYVVAEGVFHDLETNSLVRREVRRSIMQHEYGPDKKKTGKKIRMNDDMVAVICNAAESIAFRNAVLRGLKVFVDQIHIKCLEAAKAADQKDLKSGIAKAVEFFKKAGIPADQICEYFEVKHPEDLNIDQLELLRAMVQTVNIGEMSLKDVFAKKIEIKEEKVVAKVEKKERETAKETFERAMSLIPAIGTMELLKQLQKDTPTHRLSQEDVMTFLKAIEEREKQLQS